MAVAGAWYRTGTCDVVNGSKIVNFAGTALLGAGVGPGHAFIGPDLRWYEIETVNTETQLTLRDTSGYAGPSQTSQAFAIMRNTNNTTVGELAARMNELMEEFDLVDRWKQQLVHNMTANADYSLTTLESYYGRIKITDTGVVLTTARNIIVPNDARPYNVHNATAQTLTVKTGAGSGVAVSAGSTVWVYCDGTDVNNLFDAMVNVNRTGGTDTNVNRTGGKSENQKALSVTDNSTGNVSAHRLTTPSATANYYYNLATIDLGSTDNADIVKTLLLTAGDGTDLTTALIEVICKQTTAISDTESKINVQYITDTTNINHDDFFLTASSTDKGTDINLWMQSKAAVVWQVQELSRKVSENVDAATPIAYNSGSWTATDPLTEPPAVTVTSDWVGIRSFVPLLKFGGATTGITYSAQDGWAWDIGPMTHFKVRIILTSKGTATGNATIGGLPTALTDPRGSTSITFSQITYGSDVIKAMPLPGGSDIALYRIPSGLNIAPLTDTVFSNGSSLYLEGSIRRA